VFVYRAHGLFLSGDSAGAIEAGQQGLEIADSMADPGLQESANFYLGQVRHWVGDYRQGAALLRRNVVVLEEELRRRGIPSRQAVNSRTFLGWCLAELGEFPEAIARADETVALSEAADRVYWLVHACSGAGLVHLRRGEFARAAAVAERAVELCRGRDFAALWAIPAAILGAAYARAGRCAEAIQLLEQAAGIASVLGAPILCFLGEAHLLAGRPNEASAVAKRALELSLAHGERGWQAWILRLQADLAGSLDRPDVAAAEDAYREASGLATALGMRPLIARCELGLGSLERRVGNSSRALEHLTAAVGMFGEMGMPWWHDTARREKDLLAPVS
jgi:tetratricopeptide (TPR) repeat protein